MQNQHLIFERRQREIFRIGVSYFILGANLVLTECMKRKSQYVPGNT